MIRGIVYIDKEHVDGTVSYLGSSFVQSQTRSL